MSLVSFTSTFGFDENGATLNLKKGYFPHFFNTSANQHYRGSLPAERFLRSQDHVQRYQFHFPNELLAYCESDVRLLRVVCEVFRREFQELAHFDPFQHNTIASGCSRDLRKSRLKRQTIASEAVTGWRLNTRYSLTALEWFEWQGERLGRPLQHVGNEGEHRIRDGNRTYYVDGFDPVTRTVYEFHGCFYHGCPKCYPQARAECHQQLHGRTFEEVYRATVARETQLRALGYTFVILWEHEWTQLKTESPDMKDKVQSYDLKAPLNPRNALFSGRTNAVRLYVDPRD